MYSKSCEKKLLVNNHRKIWRQAIAITIALIFCLLIQMGQYAAAGQYVVQKTDNMNHWEWANTCLHAMDVEMSISEEKAYAGVGDLADAILSKSGLQVRYAPDYKVCRAESSADISKVQNKVNDKGYKVRLNIKSGEYIDILLRILPDSEAAKAETDNTSQYNTQEDHALKKESAKTAGESKRGVMPSGIGVAVAVIAAVIIALVVKFELLPDIFVIRWHRKIKSPKHRKKENGK